MVGAAASGAALKLCSGQRFFQLVAAVLSPASFLLCSRSDSSSHLNVLHCCGWIRVAHKIHAAALQELCCLAANETAAFPFWLTGDLLQCCLLQALILTRALFVAELKCLRSSSEAVFSRQ